MAENQAERTRRKKGYFELKHSQRTKRKRAMEEAFKSACEGLHPEIKSVKVDLTFGTSEGERVMSFSPRSETKENVNPNLQWQKAEENSALCKRVLAIQDKFRISQEALHEIHMLGSLIPSRYYLDDERKRMNTVLPLHNVAELEDCTRRSINDILEYVSDGHTEGRTKLLLRFSCDGAKLTKKINSVRGVFKILHPRDSLPASVDQLSMSPDDELTLFFHLGDENRTVTEVSTKETFAEMKICAERGVELNDKRIQIEWVLSCDWKALTILKGLNSANSQFFCVWCYCEKSQICDFSIPSWDIKRSTEDQMNDLSNGRKRGYIKPDLLPFIAYKNVVPDDLHLRIRISLKLFNQVVTWAIDQQNEERLEHEMRRIGVSFHFWDEQGDDKNNISVKKWSQPSGDDLRLIITKIQLRNVIDDRTDRHLVNVESLTAVQLRDELRNRGISSKGKKADLVYRLKQALGRGVKVRARARSRLQVNFQFDESENEEDNNPSLDVEGLQQLWDDFHYLMEALRALPQTENYIGPDEFHRKAKMWATTFRKLTFDEDVTPYIHTMVYHVPYFLKKFTYIHDIGVSQVERKNYDHRQAYFGSTNRSGGKTQKKVSLQILQRENRMLYASRENCLRTKRAYTKRQ